MSDVLSAEQVQEKVGALSDRILSYGTPPSEMESMDNLRALARQAMLTPGYVLEPIRELLGGIGLDPCTEPDNPTGADRFYCLPVDGCASDWNASTIFVNPPYGEQRGRWVDRCIQAHRDAPSRKIVLLIPSHTETRVFQTALEACKTVLFVRARLRFGVPRENGRQETASHGSAIFGFGVDVSPLASTWGLGVALTVSGGRA